jgi:DNA-binding GntR family transcriptional regulator
MVELHRSLSQRAYHSLRHRIVEGELVPGQRLSLRKVASSLGMSMAPVGEALRELNRDGLIEMEPGWGARVRRLDAESLRNQHVLRTAIECEAIRHCTERATDAQLKALATLANELDGLIDQHAEPARVFELDSRFHLNIAELSGAAGLVNALQANQLVRMLARGSVIAHRLVRPPQQHIALVKAIRSRDPDEAEAAMREHCLRSMKLQLAHLALPDYEP